MKRAAWLFSIIAVLGCKRPTETVDAGTKEIIVGDVKMMVPGDTKLEDAGGIFTLTRPARSWKQDTLVMSPLSKSQYDIRAASSATRGALARSPGQLSYRVDVVGSDLTLAGEIDIAGTYFYVTCHAFAVDGAKQSLDDWCLPILRSSARR
jgi:hypothetical protein